MTSCDKTQTPILCATRGCGFYGTSSSHNLCSQCYKGFLKQEEAKIVETLSNNISSSSTIHDDSQNLTNNVDSTMKIEQRCMICKKKVGLIRFSCRCEGMFCKIHRFPEEHNCTFDFKTVGRVALAEENPLYIVDKFETRI